MVRSFRFRSTSVPAESYDFDCRAPDHLSKARAALSDLENLSHISRVHDNHFICDVNEHVHTSQLPPLRSRPSTRAPCYTREYSVPSTYDDSYTRSETRRMSLAADTAVKQAQREVSRVQRELDISSCDTTAPRKPRRYSVASPDIGHTFSYHSYHPEHTATRYKTLPHQLHTAHITPHKHTYSPINLIRCLTDTHNDYYQHSREYYHHPLESHHHLRRPQLEDYHIRSTSLTPLRSRSVHTSTPYIPTQYTQSYLSPTYHTPTHHTPTHQNSLFNYYYHLAPHHTTTTTPTYHAGSLPKHEISKHHGREIQTLIDAIQDDPSIHHSSLPLSTHYSSPSPSIHHSTIHHTFATPSIHHTTTYPSLPPRPHSTKITTPTVTTPVQYYHTGLERPIEEHREVSETRKRVRDVLCKVKKNPNYFDL